MHKHIKINLILKIYAMFVDGTSTSAVQRLAVYIMHAVTVRAETCTMVNVTSGWCCWFEDVLAT